MTQNKELNHKLLQWNNALLGEAATIAYRVQPDMDVTAVFFDDLAFSLERLAERVRREQKELFPEGEETA